MDFLSIALVPCIGNAVAWLIALNTKRDAFLLLWNLPFGTAGAALCALAIAWLAPTLGVAGLVIGGPLASLLAIYAGQAIGRTL